MMGTGDIVLCTKVDNKGAKMAFGKMMYDLKLDGQGDFGYGVLYAWYLPACFGLVPMEKLVDAKLTNARTTGVVFSSFCVGR